MTNAPKGLRRVLGPGLFAAGLVAGSFLLAPGTAYAASSSGVIGSQLIVNAEAGKANAFRLGQLNTQVEITDSGDVITPGAGCVSVNRNTVRCDVTNVTSVRINAGDQDDTVDSQVLFETIVNAGDGDDTVSTSGRDDTLSGGPGDDKLNGGAGNDKVSGGADADVLDGGPGTDTLDGDAGPDVLNGGDGTDTADYHIRTAGVTVDLDGVADDGTTGVEGDNVGTDVENILGGSAADVLTGSDLATVQNRLVGNDGADKLTGFAGVDQLVGGAGADTLNGGDGRDHMFPGTGSDVLNGGAGDDEVSYSDRTAFVRVTLDGKADDGESGENDNVGLDMEDVSTGSGGSSVTGNAAGNVFAGGSGSDFFDGKAGDDQLIGFAGDDTLTAGAGNDLLNGGTGDDTLTGGKDDDTLLGGDDDDTLSGGELGLGDDGSDDFDGGLGFDVVDYSDHGGIPVTASMDSVANDGATGQNEGDDIDFGIEMIIGGSGADVLIGDDNANTLIGGKFPADGGDQLFGKGGSDRLEGRAGNDTLDCDGFSPSSGTADVGDGGAGVDTAVFGHGCETLISVP